MNFLLFDLAKSFASSSLFPRSSQNKWFSCHRNPMSFQFSWARSYLSSTDENKEKTSFLIIWKNRMKSKRKLLQSKNSTFWVVHLFKEWERARRKVHIKSFNYFRFRIVLSVICVKCGFRIFSNVLKHEIRLCGRNIFEQPLLISLQKRQQQNNNKKKEIKKKKKNMRRTIRIGINWCRFGTSINKDLSENCDLQRIF